MIRAPVPIDDIRALVDWIDGRGYVESAKMLTAVADELEAFRKAADSAPPQADEHHGPQLDVDATAEERAALDRIGGVHALTKAHMSRSSGNGRSGDGIARASSCMSFGRQRGVDPAERRRDRGGETAAAGHR
jgi:hypothetical protein